MRGKVKYKFKVINGVLSWKNDEMERFMPISAEILTRVILLYEREFKNGIRIWEQLAGQVNLDLTGTGDDPLLHELTSWMEQLQSIFANTEPVHEKEKWTDDQFYLN